MKHKILIINLLLLFSLTVKGQLSSSARLEFEKKDRTELMFEVLPLEKEGLLLTKKSNDYFGKSPVWAFTKYDTDLKSLWTTEFEFPRNQFPLLRYHDKQFLYWLIAEPDEQTGITILKINLQNGDTDEFKGDLLAVTEVSHFRVVGNKAVIGGLYNQKPVVALFSFFDGNNKVLPGVFGKEITLNSIEIDEDREEINVIMHDFYKKTGCKLTLNRYDIEGKLLSNVAFPMADDRSLISGQLVKINAEESLLVGNYSTGCTKYSQGLYISKLHQDEVVSTKYIDFADFKSFFNYLKPKRQEKVQEKIQKKKDLGQQQVFRYSMLVHDLLPNAEGFVLVAEAYYPTYKAGGSSTIAPLFNQPLNSSRSFDRSVESFRYTHALVCGLDKEGNLQWDNNFVVDNLESDMLTEQVQAIPQGQRIVLAYPKEGTIQTQTIDKQQILEEKQRIELKLETENERIVWTESDALAAWFEGSFVSFGYQKIENTSDNYSQREVFFINKWSYAHK